jgi:TonB family protein
MGVAKHRVANFDGDHALSSAAKELPRALETEVDLDVTAPGGVEAVAEIIAVTTQDDFLLELGAVVGGQAAVNPVESVTLALERLGTTRRAPILAIDTRDVADLRDSIGRAYARSADIAILLFANAADEESLRQAFRTSKITSVLPIPIDPARTALVLADTLADAVGQHGVAPNLGDALLQASPAPAAAAHAAQVQVSERHARMQQWVVGVGLAMLLLATIPWFLFRHTPQASPAASEPSHAPAAPAALVSGRLDELLERARTAMAERRYTEPAGDNALLYYRSAQAADSGNAEAHDGLARVAAVLINRFDENLRQSQLEEAAQTLASFKAAAPQDLRGSALDVRLEAAKTRAELAQREAQARLKHQADVEAQSAREQEAAQRKASEHAAALAAAKAAQERAEAASARQAEEAAAAAAAQSASAAKTSAAEHAAIAPEQLKLTRYVAPDYPPAALLRNQSGNVTVEYTVDVKGATRDVRVLSAEPVGIFEHSAADAVKHWRYAPVIVNGAPISVPTRTVIQFKPQ